MIELSRRNLLRAALATPLAASLASLAESAQAQDKPDVGVGPYSLPPLPYKYNALEPHIDRQTMQLHHDKHHATYVKNLNDAATKNPEIAGRPPLELVRNLAAVPETVRTTVRNNAGGHVNHSMFWEIMKPGGGGAPRGQILTVINKNFGTFDNFKTQFNDAGLKRFGSGWVWLARTKDGKIEIVTTPNQDNPFMDGHYPILGNDVWEHAYYLRYQNRRADYLKAWWNTVNWDAINQRAATAMQL